MHISTGGAMWLCHPGDGHLLDDRGHSDGNHGPASGYHVPYVWSDWCCSSSYQLHQGKLHREIISYLSVVWLQNVIFWG